MNRIRQLRQAAHIRQTDLANTLGISQGTLSLWEHGVYEPNDYLLVKMARYFHVTTDYLVGKNADLPEKYDEDTLAFLDLIQNRNEVKTLLRAAKNATKEEIETVITMLEEIIRSYA